MRVIMAALCGHFPGSLEGLGPGRVRVKDAPCPAGLGLQAHVWWLCLPSNSESASYLGFCLSVSGLWVLSLVLMTNSLYL